MKTKSNITKYLMTARNNVLRYHSSDCIVLVISDEILRDTLVVRKKRDTYIVPPNSLSLSFFLSLISLFFFYLHEVRHK